MRKRIYWQNRLESAWEESSVLWLSGVRKTGKTLLCKSMSDIEYFDSELPGTRRMLRNPHAFLGRLRGKRVVLDEVHRLRDPASLLKTAAVDYPDVKILATGPSSLKGSPGFQKDLTGRMREIWLTPVMSAGMNDFGNPNMIHRLRAGGLPPFLLSENPTEKEYQEWMDAYWAKDVQDRFKLEKRWSFQQFLEQLFRHSGEIFEASRYAEPCDISRPTVTNYLKVMESTFAAHVIRPFSSRRPTEIVSAPRVYAFDTGFICFSRGCGELDHDRIANLWEHLILNEIQSRTQKRDIMYWRDKHGREVDFLLVEGGHPATAIQCSWVADEADIRSFKTFRRVYPGGENWVIANDVEKPFELSERGLTFRFMGLGDLAAALEGKNRALSA